MAHTILITGCSGSNGFGRLSCEALARRGHRVFAGMRDVAGRNARAAEELRAFTSESGGSITPVEIDVLSDASVEAGVASVLAATGGTLDAVVNNAAVPSFGLSESYTGDQVAYVFNVNVAGAQRVNRAVLPSMRARGQGLLIHIGSTIGRVVVPAMGLYCATKFAMEAIAETFRYELAPLGVESVLIQPGAFPTGFLAGNTVPADPGRVDGYGPVAKLTDHLMTAFGHMFSGSDAPNPQAVADAVVALVEAPVGQRPARTVVDGRPDGTLAINGACAQVQAGLLGGLGLEWLEKVVVREPAA